MPAPLTLSRTEAADLVGVPPETFSAWIGKGLLPGPIPGTRRYLRLEIETRLAAAVGMAGEAKAKPGAYERRRERIEQKPR